MCGQPMFSAAELELIIELLERERSELSPEIRHTRTAKLREELHRRKDMVRSLLERLQSPAGI